MTARRQRHSKTLDVLVVCHERIRAFRLQATEAWSPVPLLLANGNCMDTAQNTANSLPTAPEFIRRAATAWIRAADAGLIDAGELTWLLAHLPPDPR